MQMSMDAKYISANLIVSNAHLGIFFQTLNASLPISNVLILIVIICVEDAVLDLCLSRIYVFIIILIACSMELIGFVAELLEGGFLVMV